MVDSPSSSPFLAPSLSLPLQTAAGNSFRYNSIRLLELFEKKEETEEEEEEEGREKERLMMKEDERRDRRRIEELSTNKMNRGKGMESY